MNSLNHIETIAKLDKIIVRHSEFSKAVNGIVDCLNKSLAYQEPIGCLLTGNGGYGKTTVCRVIMSKMPLSTKREDAYEKTIIPAFYSSVPSPATVKSVAAALLTQLNDPSPLAGTTSHMTKRLCLLLKQCETKLVFLDEFHHLFAIQKTSTKINSDVCNWIKSLVNETRISFCLVGTPDFVSLLATDTQLSRRFPVHFKLQLLKLDTKKQIGHLKPFVAEITKQAIRIIGLQSLPNFNDEHTSHQLLAATTGNPAFVMSLIKESLLVCLNSGRNAVTTDDFATAWDSGITARVSLTKENPFRMNPGVLAANMRRGYAHD
jgi:hypothetical protein